MSQFRCDCVYSESLPRCPLRLEIGDVALSQSGDNQHRVIPFRIAGSADLHSVPTVFLDRSGVKSLIALLGKKVELLDGE